MGVPYRHWVQFNTATLEAYHPFTATTQADWTIKHLDFGDLG